MTHATACLATKESVLLRSGSQVLMMVAYTPARPSTTWERPKWTASWRSKVSVDQEVAAGTCLYLVLVSQSFYFYTIFLFFSLDENILSISFHNLCFFM